MIITPQQARTIKLQPNYSLHEFLEGTALSKQAIDMNYELLTVEQLCKIGMIAYKLQDLRNKTLAEFGVKFKGFRITAGLRQKQWELMRKRSGNSQHVQGWAVDIQPICDVKDYAQIFNWVFKSQSGFFGGLAQSPFDLQKNSFGFIHLDLRGEVARWTY